MIVLLNRRASYGRAGRLWAKVQPEVERRAGSLQVREIGCPADVHAAVREAAARGERVFVAAGGDGTVNLVLNALMDLGDLSGVALGAVGLGSSNDFHKPFEKSAFMEGVPVRVDCRRPEPRDVIRIDFGGGGSGTVPPGGGDGVRTRYAIINASVGIAAEANASFNEPSRFIRAVRRVSVDAAIVASVIRTLATYRDVSCRITIDGKDEGSFRVSSLGIIKNPHFAGTFCYDTRIEPDDGKLGVNLCEGLTRFQVMATLAALSRRRFCGRPKTRSWTGERVTVEGDRLFALEADGEVVRARRAEFTVLPRKIRCCR